MSLTNVGSSVSGVDVTVTATSDVDCSTGVYGVEIIVNDIPTIAVDQQGAVASQTITVGADEGLQLGDTVKLTPYYDLTPFGSPESDNSRVYGSQVTVVLGSSSNAAVFAAMHYRRRAA